MNKLDHIHIIQTLVLIIFFGCSFILTDEYPYKLHSSLLRDHYKHIEVFTLLLFTKGSLSTHWSVNVIDKLCTTELEWRINRDFPISNAKLYLTLILKIFKLNIKCTILQIPYYYIQGVIPYQQISLSTFYGQTLIAANFFVSLDSFLPFSFCEFLTSQDEYKRQASQHGACWGRIFANVVMLRSLRCALSFL